MLIEALPDTFFVLEIELDGVEYSILPHDGSAYVPAALGLALERAQLARIVDRDAEPEGEPWLDGDRYAPWVTATAARTLH
jgi:hypothetical protein